MRVYYLENLEDELLAIIGLSPLTSYAMIADLPGLDARFSTKPDSLNESRIILNDATDVLLLIQREDGTRYVGSSVSFEGDTPPGLDTADPETELS